MYSSADFEGLGKMIKWAVFIGSIGLIGIGVVIGWFVFN
ncbi:putative membrane protein [Bacillus cereus]|uniref:Uncharacterized protein n=2 Tax=root TaxID=1 RepID=A0A1Y5YWS1_9BACI|nr:hypothetical protein HWA88_gp22 [Bacillus phage vB_BceS-MY192]EEK97103.1 hypothetical protein bcere0013_57700 [Bacillus cereus BDRD-ST26]KFK74068.1 putative membrane protein [Bacillus cereus]UTQ80106.1 hypothetical protein vBBceSLY4_000029 [Bacillus phage vB_BceS_LY4]SMD65622.1 hypothetical protein BACERE00191_00404 [Bacillus pacificus]SME40545.1 hypothetical protein BACERE00176_04339 [Bacillus paranthracis]